MDVNEGFGFGGSGRERVRGGMIWSRLNRFLFIHQAKTGGTAVTLALEPHLAPGDVVLGDTPGARAFPPPEGTPGNLWKHARLSDLAALVPAAELAETHVFTVVRNPFDRMVSFYAWAQGQRFRHPMVDAAKALTFSQFVRERHVVAAVKGSPTAACTCDASGVERCRTFLRFETLEADLVALGRVLGLTIGPLPRVNESPRDQYREYYRPRDVEHVQWMCWADIDRFGYSF